MKLNELTGLKLNEPMSAHTTFRIGGPADMLYEPQDNEELLAALECAKAENVPVTVIGNGSNLLVSDKGIRGLVIKIGKKFSGISKDGEYVTVKSGTKMSQFGMFALENELGGAEFAHGIPGSVGGGIYMNAGAYGGELKDIIVSAEYVKDGKLCRIDKDDMQLGYRKSIFQSLDAVITSVTFKLKPDTRENILSRMNDFKSRRQEKQPLEYPSAGSTFKRPEGYFAGALIEEAGLKGKSIGGAQVSEKHAGFIINTGNATAKDVCDLVEYIKKTVFESSGVMLETEIKMIGER